MLGFLLLSACAPKGTAQLDDLMALGAYEAACERARGDEAAAAHVAARTWAATSVQLRARALTTQELGGVADGWAAWDVVVGADATVVPSVTARVTLRDAEGRPWTACRDCDADWVLDQLSVGDVVEVQFEAHDGEGGGGLFRALGEVVRLTLGVPLAMTVDLALAPIQALAGRPDQLGTVTRWMLDPSPLPVAPLVTSDEPEPSQAALSSLWVLRPREEAGEPVTAELDVSGRHLGGCPIPGQRGASDVRDGAVEAAW